MLVSVKFECRRNVLVITAMAVITGTVMARQYWDIFLKTNDEKEHEFIIFKISELKYK